MDELTAAIRIIMGVLSRWLVFILLYQLVISFFGYKRRTKDYEDHDPETRFLVLIPAHNEEAVIGGIIRNLQHMDYPSDMYDFYILADNCDDGTAEVARSMGANVLESFPESADAPTGKPIVLQRALNTLEGYQDKYDMVVFFDADNLIDADFFREINSQYISNGKKVDAIQCYLGCKNKKGVVARFYYMSYTITNRFFQFAKNRLGLNNVIGGTGFAVSAKYLYSRGGWTAMSLTEDFELQIESTCEGRRIMWNHNVRIYDEKPTRFRASFRQRVRWAQGHWFVAFKNTPKLFKALFTRKISIWEFISTFLYMYSLTPYIVLVFQLLLGIAMQVLVWFGLADAANTSVSLSSWLTLNWPGIAVFFYSFVFLFYLSDYLDNHIKADPRSFFPMLWSLLINTFVAGWAQVVGLFRHRQQHTWVKTEHKINLIDNDMLRAEDAERNAQPTGDAHGERINDKPVTAESSR